MKTPAGNVVPPYSAGGKSHGYLVLPDGREFSIQSGYLGPTRNVRGVPKMHGNIKSHVEAHASVIMRREHVREAVLYINRVPCPTLHPRVLGCEDALPHMLPENARLRVIAPEGYDRTFVGLPDPNGISIVGL